MEQNGQRGATEHTNIDFLKLPDLNHTQTDVLNLN